MSNLVGTVVAERFRVVRRIGGGSFGEIFLCLSPNDTEVAAKFEKKGHVSPQLRHEYKVYRELKGSRGICSVFFFGDHARDYNVVVMELMGPSLEDLFEKCSKRFSLKTVLQIAEQLVVRITTLHEKSIIHRDIKPQNFVIGLHDASSEIFCIDFGLAKLYRDRKTLMHLPRREGALAGTPRYASINNHTGIAQSRRDDFESIAYMLIYFLKGKLPWQGLKANDKRKKYHLILQSKRDTTIPVLCEGLPKAFADFLQYARGMKFDEKPDLEYVKNLFHELYVARGYSMTQGKVWDWDPPVAIKLTEQGQAPIAAGWSNRAVDQSTGEMDIADTTGNVAVPVIFNAEIEARKAEGIADDDSLAANLGADENGGLETLHDSRPSTAPSPRSYQA